ncbi:hypothetical protein T265_04720 [Opisthorchis viverrini]|uniref:Uncharacterized protein n=1 Tax=Opisthorchis viverrini TaxID=6198 RepID=A0A075AG85_OPIVI|nr:hypothetical protein T265_04720 [Opisthorchis viverrini]KER28499.1 hypothetical protein T265_04720 [Opisthorchis viverrini]
MGRYAVGMRASRCLALCSFLMCIATNTTSYESANLLTTGSWFEPDIVYSRPHSVKKDPLVEEVELVNCNPQYAAFLSLAERKKPFLLCIWHPDHKISQGKFMVVRVAAPQDETHSRLILLGAKRPYQNNSVKFQRML